MENDGRSERGPVEPQRPEEGAEQHKPSFVPPRSARKKSDSQDSS